MNKIKEAAIALASLTMTIDRLKVVDFSYPVDYFYKNLYIRMEAVTQIYETETYTKSFDWLVWLVMMMQLVIFVVALWIICSYLPQETPDMRTTNDIAFILFACLCQQGAPNTPVSYLGRTVFIMWWVFSLVMYAHYTAMLTSRLTLNTDGPPFTSLKGAVDNKEWQVGILSGTPILQMLGEADKNAYPYHVKLYNRITENKNLLVSTEQEGYDRALDNMQNFAFFTDNPMMDYLINNGHCNVRTLSLSVKDSFWSYGHLGYMKNLPFAQILDEQLAIAKDGGLLDRLRKKWWGKSKTCIKGNTVKNLGFHHTYTAFMPLVAGIIISSLTLFIEYKFSGRPSSSIKKKQVTNRNTDNSHCNDVVNKSEIKNKDGL